ncbi:DUF2968 domain-containing protein, partial [Paraburkholderia sp. Ac-20340]|nr:DUF2968 domain-containing protein [Paraburkholderia sp. Ac-20340]
MIAARVVVGVGVRARDVAAERRTCAAAQCCADQTAGAAAHRVTRCCAGTAAQRAADDVAELQQMIRGSELNELRTTYNGTYGASLLFYGKEMTYYVAL